jgi:hypothetical protein
MPAPDRCGEPAFPPPRKPSNEKREEGLKAQNANKVVALMKVRRVVHEKASRGPITSIGGRFAKIL